MLLYTFTHLGTRSSTIYLQIQAENVLQAVQLWLTELETASIGNSEIALIERSKIDRMRIASNEENNQPIAFDGLKNIWTLEFKFKKDDLKVLIIQTAK